MFAPLILAPRTDTTCPSNAPCSLGRHRIGCCRHRAIPFYPPFFRFSPSAIALISSSTAPHSACGASTRTCRPHASTQRWTSYKPLAGKVSSMSPFLRHTHRANAWRRLMPGHPDRGGVPRCRALLNFFESSTGSSSSTHGPQGHQSRLRRAKSCGLPDAAKHRVAGRPPHRVRHSWSFAPRRRNAAGSRLRHLHARILRSCGTIPDTADESKSTASFLDCSISLPGAGLSRWLGALHVVVPSRACIG
jgi:hypothetical protein